MAPRAEPLFIFRAGLPVAVPANYASLPEHLKLVDQLTTTNSFLLVVALLEQHSDSYLAADFLTGAPWAQRFLNTLGKLKVSGARTLVRRGQRALVGVLAGVKPKRGRPKSSLTPAQTLAGAEAIARSRVVVDRAWAGDRADLVAALTKGRTLSAAHRRSLVALVRRPSVRKIDLVLSLASWETGIPRRRLHLTRPVADLVYG